MITTPKWLNPQGSFSLQPQCAGRFGRMWHEATHWTGRAMAKAIGISVGSVQRIWRAHKLQPHRLRTFKRSRDPRFAAKLTDIDSRSIRERQTTATLVHVPYCNAASPSE
jgi:hypothetical protein